MNIRVLPHLDSRQQWIAFCQREAPYCFVQQPDTLVDFQSNHLVITLLNQQVRNGKEAIKFSIGSRLSIEPAWHFIKSCEFNLSYMVEGLRQLEFEGNARDNASSEAFHNINIRRFFAKERAVISPAFLGPLEPLTTLPAHWDIYHCCRLLANEQWRDYRNDSPVLPGKQGADRKPPLKIESLLVALVEQLELWQTSMRESRLYIYRDRNRVYSLIPDLNPASGALPSTTQETMPQSVK